MRMGLDLDLPEPVRVPSSAPLLVLPRYKEADVFGRRNLQLLL
jgi:hypothetical protein